MALLEDNKVTDNVIDIDLSITAKKRFRIDGDNDRILELNVSDMSIISRFKDIYPRLEKLAVDAQGFQSINEDDENALDQMADKFTSIDTEMRKLVDDIFQSEVSKVCAPEGSMYDPFNGKFRFEIILEKLIDLHTSNIREEFKRMETKVAKHTAKYTKKKRK